MGVWLGWHICYNATQVSQVQLRENRNLSLSIRAKAALIYVLSVTVHNDLTTWLCPSRGIVSSSVKARPSDPFDYIWILWSYVVQWVCRLLAMHELVSFFTGVSQWVLLFDDLLSMCTFDLLLIYGERCQKSYHRDNWLVAAERSKRCGFLILRCRLFLSCCSILQQGWVCSPTNGERELGLDRRETG